MRGVCPFAMSRQKAASEAAQKVRQNDEDNHAQGKDQSQSPTSPTPLCSAGFGFSDSKCPLGFGSYGKGLLTSFNSLPQMPLAVLARHESSSARLVSVKGVIFDVSSDGEFSVDGKHAHLPGHDASRFFAIANSKLGDTTDPLADLDAGLEGLTYEDHKRLESRFMRVAKEHGAVAILADKDHKRIFGMTFGGQEQRNDCQANGPRPTAADELHTFVEHGNAEAIRGILQGGISGDVTTLPPGTKDSKLVDTPCRRTGMTPLLKAVEGASEDVVRILLEAGADVRRQATLYDGDDAIALARRLGSRDTIVEILVPHYSTPKR